MAAAERKRRAIVRKRRARWMHHGAAWKVAYGDFVTAMMALFIVLWLLTQADMRLRQQIAQYFRSQGVLSGGAYVSSDAIPARSREPRVVSRDFLVIQGNFEEERFEEERKSIDETLREAAEGSEALALLRDQVIVQVTDAGLSIQVVDRGRNLLFDPSSATLKPGLVELLRHLAPELGRLPNAVLIGGHTDGRPFPPDAEISNWDLAFARADAARKVLEASGLRAGQIRRVVSHADSEPLVPDNPLAAENRRLSILAARSAPALAGPDPTGAPPIVFPPDPLPAGGRPR